MKKLIPLVLLVLSSTALLQAQLRAHNKSRTEVSLSSISLSAMSVVGGNPLIGTVHLTAPAPLEGVVVTLVVDDPSDSDAQCVVPVSVLVPAGATSASFAIQTSAVSSNLTMSISGTYGVTRRASFVLTDADSAPTPDQPESAGKSHKAANLCGLLQ